MIGQQGSCLDNSISNKSDNSLDSSSDNSLVNRLFISPTLGRVGKTTAWVELRLSLIQQMGDTRRRVTDVAGRGTKATAQRRSSLSRSSLSGKRRQASKYRWRKRPKENRACTLTSANSTTYRFPHILVALIKSLMHYLLINNIL